MRTFYFRGYNGALHWETGRICCHHIGIGGKIRNVLEASSRNICGIGSDTGNLTKPSICRSNINPE